MISFNNFSYKVLLPSTKSNSINNNEKNLNKEVLGYQVDKDGFFTSDFNKAAGIPSDFKIHSSSLESLVNAHVKPERPAMIDIFVDVDIAKSVGNAYKVLMQVVGKDTLERKYSFSIDEIAQFPQGYEYNSQTMYVSKIHNTPSQYLNADSNFNWNNNTNTRISSLFYNSFDDVQKGLPATKIFNNNNGGKESIDFGSFFNPNGEKYTNNDGSITKGGLLVAMLNNDSYLVEGTTTMLGKAQGYDKNINSSNAKQIHDLLFNNPFGGLIVDIAGHLELFKETDPDKFMEKYTEFMRKNQQELNKASDKKAEYEKNLIENAPFKKWFDELEKIEQKRLERLSEQKKKEQIAKLDIKA